MIKLGIRAHDIGKYSMNELAERVRNIGFDGVQLVIKKALIEPFDSITPKALNNAFDKPFIMMLGAYFNPLHPNPKEVENGVNFVYDQLRLAHDMGCAFVGTETGSYMGSPWGYMKENHEDDALYEVVAVFKPLSKEAEKLGVYFAIEGAYAHVAYSPKRLKQLYDHLGSPSVKIILDVFNYLNIDNYQHHLEICNEALNLFKDEIVIVHLKDFIVQDQSLKLVGLGQGLMNYDVMLPMIVKAIPNAYLIFEGVTGPDIISSFQWIRHKLERIEEI
jgi:sugar phosphate isomerase/epimerase